MLSAMLSRYLKTHFVEEAAFARSAGIRLSLLRALMEAGALPGPIYRCWESGAVWSPIGGWIGEEDSGIPLSEWFSPAAIWWARRAAILTGSGLTASQAAERLREIFLADFSLTLGSEPIAKLAYPEAFRDSAIDPEKGREAGLAEWEDWINGGYGVCLRRFDARSLVIKTGEAARVRLITQSGTKETLTADEKLDLLNAMEKLDAVMLPFAPHQRPNGTPGFWVDAPLARYGLGSIPLVESIAPEDPALKCA